MVSNRQRGLVDVVEPTNPVKSSDSNIVSGKKEHLRSRQIKDRSLRSDGQIKATKRRVQADKILKRRSDGILEEGSESDRLDSDDEGEANRIGSVPLRWYENHQHVGYGVDGKKIQRTLDLSEVTKLLRDADDPESWKTISDIKNQTTFKLTPTDLEVIRRVRESSFPLPSFDPYGPDSIVDFDNPDAALHPSNSAHPPKRRFQPSLWENKRVNELVKLIRQGRIRPEPLEEPEVYDLWGASILTEICDISRGRVRGPPPLPAPKPPLPGHAESYNPSEEFLFNDEEQREWENNDPEDRELSFIPRKFDCLRRVPLYANNIRERFDRCLDLYLCPRALKMRMNVDPDSLLPVLPSPKDLRPFPSALSVCYDSNEISAATQLAFDATGSYLAVGRANGVVEVFDVILSRRLTRWEGEGEILALAFNPTLPILAFNRGTAVYVVVLRLPTFFESSDDSNRDRKVANTENSIPSSWDILTALNALQVSSGNPLPGVSDIWTPLMGSDVGALAIGGWKIEHKSEVTHINWHSRGLYFTTVSTHAGSPSLQLGIHSLSKLKTIRPFRKNVAGRVQRALFHPNKNWLFVAFYKSLRLYSLEKTANTPSQVGGLIKRFTGADEISDIGVHPSGDHVIVGGINRRLTWFDLDLGEKPYKILRYHKAAVKSVGFHKSYPLMCSSAVDGCVHIFHSKVFSDLMSSPAIIPVKKLNPSSDMQSSPDPSPVLHCQWHPTQPWEISAMAGGGGHVLKSFLALGHSEATLFDGSALSSETENKQALRDGDDFQKIAAMRQLLATFSEQRRLDRLLPEVVKVMGSSNVELKRLCYLYVILSCQKVLLHSVELKNAAHERAVLLLTINAFQKDSSYRNHIIRAWALRSMSSLQMPEVIPSLSAAIYRGAADGSPYVRQAAAQAVPKLVLMDPTLLGSLLEGVLLRLIGDIEISVVSLAFQSFYEILLMLPSLSSLEPKDISQFEPLFGLNSVEPSTPFLSVLHPHFCHSVTEALARMTSHGQVSAIQVFTIYCRTFFTCPTSSPHFESFVNQLWEILRFTPSISVATTSISCLLHIHPDDTIFDRICPYLFHWLRIAGHSLTSSGGHVLVEVLKIVAHRQPHQLIAEVPMLLLNYRDSGFLRRGKLQVLEILAADSEFPFNLVFDDLLNAVHWDFPVEDGFCVAELLDFITKISLKRVKSVDDPDSALDRCTRELMALMINSSSVPLVDEAIRCLRDVSLSQFSNSRHMHAIVLHVAQRLAADCSTSAIKEDGRFRGRAAMIGLVAAHHDAVYRIALDVFRVLVDAVATGHHTVSPPPVQLEIINLGASLWSFYYRSKTSSDGMSPVGTSQDVFQKLDRLWRFLLSHLGATAEDHCIKEVVWLLSQLCVASSSETHHYLSHFGKVFGCPGQLRDTVLSRSRTLQSPNEGSFIAPTLSSVASPCFRGLDLLPSFPSPVEISEGQRVVPPDSVRLRTSVPAERSVKAVGNMKLGVVMSENNEDELDEFYRATEHDVRLVMGNARHEDPLLRLFGSQASRGSKAVANFKESGVMVFGEEDETDSECGSSKVEQQVHVGHIDSPCDASDDEDDDDEWNSIEKSLRR